MSGQVVLLAQLEVLGAAARGDVHDARAFRLADLIPQDHRCAWTAL